MPLQFYYGAGSPYAWRVWLALEHQGVPYERTTISFSKRETHTPEFSRLNPRCKVPVIVDGDFVLYESAAILEYLDERFPEAPRLFPGSVRDRATVRRVVREVDSYLGTEIGSLGDQLFVSSPDERSRPTVEAAATGLRDELPAWERVLAGDYLHGNTLSAADFSLYPLLALLPRFEKRMPELGLSAELGPRVTAWMRRIEALPYFRKTYPAHWT
jgi:glutathione S-transferase